MPQVTFDLEELRRGSKRLLARTLSRLETERDTPEVARFLDVATGSAGGHVLGLTGPPGVGKSTLTDVLMRRFRAEGDRVSVLAIDPSSQFTGGALLGDRTRLTTDPEDDALFVRSMAARDRLGGLSDHAVAAIALLRAVSDRVIVESVGIGQSESDLVHAADTVLLCIQPGSGDSLQFMKAGIMELPDIVAVTKADVGTLARRAASDVSGALSLARAQPSDWKVPVCEVSARESSGLADLFGAIADHQAHLAKGHRGRDKRRAQHRHWLEDMIRTRFGTAGLVAARQIWKSSDRARGEGAPFSSYRDLSGELHTRLGLI